MESDRAKSRQFRLAGGPIVDFDADAVCQLLFELTEELGRPDAFLARELTDGLAFFLSNEMGEQIPSIAELADLVEKYVRELGHPILAQRFRSRVDGETSTNASAFWLPARRQGPKIAIPDPLPEPRVIAESFSDAQLVDYSLTTVFPRDVASMHRDGLLTLAGLSRPFELAGSVLNAGVAGDIQEIGARIEAARQHTGLYLAIDSAEILLGNDDPNVEAHASELARLIDHFSRENCLALVVNLNLSRQSESSDGAVGGSLFQSDSSLRGRADSQSAAIGPIHELSGQLFQIVWHLSGRDFQPENADRLRSAAQLAISSPNWEFAFDRPRFETFLAAGLTREKPAVLLVVGIHLFRLVQQLSSDSFDAYLRKLGSLARLARSAGHAKFDFLRKRARAEVRRGFMLDRARLLVAPLGLEAAVRELTQCPISDGGRGSEAATAIIERLREALNLEPRANLDICIDEFPPAPNLETNRRANAETISGPTPWDADSMPRMQLKAAALLQSAAGAGTAQIWLGPGQTPKVEEVTALLRACWHQSEIHRIQFRLEGIE